MLDKLPEPKRPARPILPDATTLGEIFLKRAERTPNGFAFQRKHEGQWVKANWSDFYDSAAAVATWLLKTGINIGDKVMVVGSTRPEWCICDIGGLLGGTVTVGAYPTVSIEQLHYLLNHSDAKIVFVEDAEQLEKVLAAEKADPQPSVDGSFPVPQGLPQLKKIVLWDTAGQEELLKERDDLLALSEILRTETDRSAIDERQGLVKPEDTAIIVYTSGTTGPPKGAMISHKNVTVVLGSTAIAEFEQDDTTLSFLPMAHVAERVLAFYGRINWGTGTAFASSIPKVLEELGEVQPTVFGSVPRIFEKAYDKIQGEVKKASSTKQRVFRWAESVAHRTVDLWQAGKPIPLGLRLQHRLADKIVFSKLRSVFGGKVKFFVTGAAPIPLRILQFFWGAGFPIFDVYGQTEATVVSHANQPGHVRLGSVGKTLPFVETKIADDGEILLRGDTVFQGYYKDEAATQAAIDKDGFLHTGDIGKIDNDGYVTIVDRKKHIIITAGGKNLTPANIENIIKTQDPMISQVHAHGDRRKYVTALVTLGPLESIEYAREKGLSDETTTTRLTQQLMADPMSRPKELEELMTKVTSQEELRRRVADAIRRGNQKLSRVEQVKRVYLLGRELSLEADEITPTLKVKRKNLEKKFAPQFDQLYEDDSFGIVIARN